MRTIGRNVWISAGVLVWCVTNLPAQIPAPGAEIFGGGSYLRVNSSDFNLGGWEASLTGNFNRTFGLEADFSQQYATVRNSPASGFKFLFGPHFAFRALPRVNPFVHFLVGGTRGTTQFEVQPPLGAPCHIGQVCPPILSPPETQTAFTTALGGGIDVKARRFLWIRVIQVDYLRQFFSGDSQNNVRVSAGIVFRFGS